jgi:hypothetical protein
VQGELGSAGVRVGWDGPVGAEQHEPWLVTSQLSDGKIQSEVRAAGVQPDTQVVREAAIQPDQLGRAATPGQPQNAPAEVVETELGQLGKWVVASRTG